MLTVLYLVFAWGLVLGINVVPVFMPPTWSVLALLQLSHHLPLLPLTLGGAMASTGGRVVLARLSQRAGKRLPERDRANAAALAMYLAVHPRWQDVIIFAYCLGPFPSNSLFIAAGIGRLPLRRVAVIFCMSRALGDTFWVWTATGVARNVGAVFTGALTTPRSIAAQVISVGLVIAVCRLPWANWLRKAANRTGHQVGPPVTADP